MSSYKFSIISYFNKSSTEEIRALQEELSAVTGSKGSLSAWVPHITVGSGLIIEEDQLDAFCNEIESFLKNFPPTKLKTKDFSFMNNWTRAKLGFSPYVAYIKPFDYGTLGDVASFFENKIKPKYPVWYDQPWPYAPHVTIAYKDLSEEGFAKAKDHLSEKVFERELLVDNVCLAIEGEDGVWREFKRFYLKA